MSTTTIPAPLDRRFQPRLAFRLLRELIRDPNDTEKVFAFFDAVGGDDGPNLFARLLADPAGRRLLDARPRLVQILADEAYLASLPEESLGGAYLRFMRARGFAPSGLLEARERGKQGAAPADEASAWLSERVNVMHDLWHVLTGYGTDELGEASLLAFSQAQIPNRSFPFLLLAAVAKGPWSWTLAWPRYLWCAYRRGRRARFLVAAPFEELLPLSVHAVRAHLRIEPPALWHPGGIRAGRLFTVAGSAA
jgi:ubiquinone biosynthesis protein COQ4